MSLSRLFLLVIILTTFSCKEKVEGCLDIYATNFNPESDESCCCEYPGLSFQVNYNYGANPYSSDQFIQDGQGNFFYLRGFNLYLSDFKALDIEGDQLQVKDLLSVIMLDESKLVIKNDFALLRPGSSNFQFKSFPTNSELSTLDFMIGLPASLDGIDIDTLASSSVLGIQPDSLFTPNVGYFSGSISYTQDTIPGSLPQVLRWRDRSPVTKQVSIPFSIGQNTCLSVGLDLLVLFENVDIKNDTPELIATKVNTAIGKAISIKSCPE
jgi:hypothetical protein